MVYDKAGFSWQGCTRLVAFMAGWGSTNIFPRLAALPDKMTPRKSLLEEACSKIPKHPLRQRTIAGGRWRNTKLVQLGKALRGARYKNGFTQEFVAQRVGITQAYISNVERGKQDCCYLTLLAIAESMELSGVGALWPEKK